MFVKQLTVFVENKSGRVSDILDALGKANIDISALSIADTSDYGLMRMITDEPQKAKEILDGAGVAVKITDALAVPIENRPGGLADVMKRLKDGGVSVEYLYAFVGRKDGGALVVLKTDDNEKAEKIIRRCAECCGE